MHAIPVYPFLSDFSKNFSIFAYDEMILKKKKNFNKNIDKLKKKLNIKNKKNNNKKTKHLLRSIYRHMVY